VLNYAGQVAVNGEAFEGNGLFKFALVSDNGTSTYWSNDGTSVDGSEPLSSISVSVNGGLYSVLLGNTANQGMGSIDPQVFAQHSDAKLRVWFSDGVNEFQQLTPDRPFASVPYAFSAGNAETANSAPIANGAVTKSMLSSEVINELDRKITMDDLDPTVIADLNVSVADGSIGLSKLSSEVSNALKPAILSQPNSMVEVAGTSTYLTVDATGGNNFYQWKKDGVDIVGATSPTLSITDLNASQHEGSYTVVVSNAFGSATSSLAQIDVNGSLTEGLVGWWKFDETEGNIAYDSSGNGNDGNLTNGPTWVEGKIGGALNFDGVDDYVNFGVRSVFNLESEITVSLWIKASDYKYAQVISKSTLSGGFTWAFKWRVSTERFYFRMYDPSGQYETFLRYNQNPALNEWSNILFSYGNSNSNLYLNSNLEAEGDFTATLTNQTNPLLVGGAGSEMFLGLIDDVRIYDRALSADEVKALYELGEEPEQASGSDTTTVVNGTVADGSITTNQLSEQILKYLKPEITQQPTAGTIFADTNGTISVSAEGKYLTYQWKKNGVNLSGETNATLTITDANATQHDGNYSVVVSNDFGSVESGDLEIFIASWVPSLSENLEIWLDATDESMIVQSSNLVSLWKDKSNIGNDASQNTSTYQPTYSLDGMSGLPGIKFDSDKLQFSNNNLVNKMCFAVINPVRFYSNGGIFFASAEVNVQLRVIPISSNNLTQGKFQYAAQSPIYNTSGNLGVTSDESFINVSENSVVGFIFDSTLGFSVNGIYSDSQVPRNSSGASTYNQIGRKESYNNYASYDGYIGEIIIINSVQDIDRQKVEGYLAHKWGVESKLHSDHPYKNSAP
jgi:hypothetical protein